MRILECTGQPGCGKSTLNRELLKHCRRFGPAVHSVDSVKSRLSLDPRSEGSLPKELHSMLGRWPVYRRWLSNYRYVRKKGQLLPDVLERWHEMVSDALDAIRGGSSILRAKVYSRRILLEHLFVYEIARMTLGESDLLWIEDEGFVRSASNIYRVYQGGDLPARVARYVSLCPKIDIVLHVKADPATLLQRIRGRDGGRLLQSPTYSGLSDEVVVRKLGDASRVYELCVRAFADSGSEIMEVDTTDMDVESAVETCKGKLAEAIGKIGLMCRAGAETGRTAPGSGVIRQ